MASLFKKDKDKEKEPSYDILEDEKTDRSKQNAEKRKKNSSTGGGLFGGIKRSLNDYVKKKIESKIMEFVSKQKPKVKDQIRDKNMPVCVQNFMDEIVEENWPVLEEEIQYQLRIRTDYPYTNQIKPNVPWYKWLPWKIRSTLQYSVMPNNKTLGQKLKNPLWLIQTLACLCPVYGVNSFYFIFLFLIIDKSDEYQLINFILQFKRFQFFAIGLIGGIVGFYLYFYCVDQNTHQDMSIQESCRQFGPGSLIHVRIDLLSFGVHLILTWIVLFFLPFSEQKGQLRFRIADKEKDKEKEKQDKDREKRKKEREKIVKKIEEKVEKMNKKGQKAQFSDFVEEYNLNKYDDIEAQEKKQNSCCQLDRGGHMKFLIIWDIIMFSLSFSFFYYNFQHENKTNFEEAKGHIFFAKWMYAILSFPFLLFSIPLVSSLLSRARPTAYDEYGNTVPVYGEIDYQDDILGDIDVDAEMNGGLPSSSNANTPQSKNTK